MANEKFKTLNDLFLHELRDLYSAETQLMEALPKMAEAAHDENLKAAFNHHLEETKGQKERLDIISQILSEGLDGETCEAMKGLIKEGEESVHLDADSDVKDAALIASGQRVEHYEMAGYGTAVHFADRVGNKEVRDLLQETLQEEKHADSKLNDLATNSINEKASV